MMISMHWILLLSLLTCTVCDIINTIIGSSTSCSVSGDLGAASSAKLCYPHAVFVDSSFNIYIADSQNNRIRKVTRSSGIITTIAGTGNSESSTVGSFSGDNGQATSATLYDPYGVVLDASSNVYTADGANNRVRKISSSTTIITTVVGSGSSSYNGEGLTGTSVNLGYPRDIAFDSTYANLYITDRDNNRIRKFIISTSLVYTVAGCSTSTGFSGDGGAATSAYLNSPRGIKVDSSGNIYIADYGNNRIRKVTAATGIITTIAGSSTSTGYSGDNGAATSSKLNYPRGVALDSSGNVYIGDTSNNRIRKVTISTGIITTVAGTGSTGFSGDGSEGTSAAISTPFTAAFDSNDNLYVVDTYNNRIRLMSKPTVSPTPSPTNAPTRVPTRSPSYTPSFSPSCTPTYLPSNAPTKTPTSSPSFSPSFTPSNSPSLTPTTASPSFIPR